MSLTYLALAQRMDGEFDAAAAALEEASALVRELGATDHFQRGALGLIQTTFGH